MIIMLYIAISIGVFSRNLEKHGSFWEALYLMLMWPVGLGAYIADLEIKKVKKEKVTASQET